MGINKQLDKVAFCEPDLESVVNEMCMEILKYGLPPEECRIFVPYQLKDILFNFYLEKYGFSRLVRDGGTFKINNIPVEIGYENSVVICHLPSAVLKGSPVLAILNLLTDKMTYINRNNE